MKYTILILLLSVLPFVTRSQVQSTSTQGTEFWTVFLQNSTHTVGVSTLELSIFVSAKRACSVTLRNPNSTWTATINVAANSLQRITMPHAQCYFDAPVGTATNKGILITSTDTISVYSSNFASATFDAANVLPTNALSNEYMIQSYIPALNHSEFSITATEDNTIVDIYPTATINNGTTTFSNQFAVTLNRGQSVFLKSSATGATGDLSGTKVIARDCKKIAVINGNSSTHIPASTSYADHVYEQALPISSWGKNFIVTNSSQRCQDRVKVTASADNTTIRKDGALLGTINEGETYEFTITSDQKAVYLQTSNPCAVYLYLVSQSVCSTEIGDPSMVWIAPIEQKISQISFCTFFPNISAANTPSSHYVNIVTETTNVPTMRLDGTNISGQFSTVSGNTTYSYARIDISHATHLISGTNGFIAHVYGLGDAVSYAYSVGSMASNLSERMFINGTVTSAMTDGSFCEDSEILFLADVDYSYNNIAWNFGDGTTATGETTTHAYDEGGEYTISMQANTTAIGCSNFSTAVNYTVTINDVYEQTLNRDAIYGETITVQGETFTAVTDTTITRTYLSVNGCDSTVTENVTVLNNETDINATICQGETYNLNGFNASTTGDYTQIFTNIHGTDSIVNLHLTVNPNPVATIIGNSAICNGSLNLAAIGGETFLWSTGAATETITVSNAGNYTVTVTDANGCTGSAQKHINPEVKILISHSEILCQGETSTIVVTASDGITPYTGIITENVTAGTYTYSVVDAEGCTSRESITITSPEILKGISEIENAGCESPFGQANITPLGGTEPYQIIWEDYNTSFNYNLIPANTYFSYTITDRNNCEYVDSVKVGQAPQVSFNITTENVSCFNGNNGQATVTNIQNGTAPYSMSWNNGSTSQNIQNLIAGNYFVTVSDNNGCTASLSATIQQATEIEIETSVTNATCVGTCDGRIVVNATGGAEGYTYEWNNGLYENAINELCVGNYMLTITDASGCIVTKTFSIIQPESLSASSSSVDVTCYGNNDGKAIITVTGGQHPYLYSLDEYMYNNTTSNIITSLSIGKHTIYINDANGCRTTTEVTIGGPERIIAEYTSKNPTCKEANDAQISVSAYGGTQPYTVTTNSALSAEMQDSVSFTGLQSGTYHVVVTDQNGCPFSIKNILIIDSSVPCLHIPNVYTPNDDGVNDEWIIRNIAMFPEAKIFVFNRWGQKMYTGDGLSEPWDGTLKGNKVPSGPYNYIIDLDNGSEPYTGTVTVVF